MFPLKLLPPKLVLASLVALSVPAFGQQGASEFKITKVEPLFQESPNFQGTRYDKRGFKPKPWLEVEVTFEWQPKAKEPKYTDELTFNYYILLKNPSQQSPKGTLLVGTVTHASIPQEREMHSAVYVSPRALEKLFDGKVPGTPLAAVEEIGVTISKQGQIVAEYSGKYRSQWWTQFQQTPGYVLNKNETPFAPLAWDYFEAIKPKSSGL